MNQLKLWIFCLYPNILKHKGTETEETVNLNFSQYFLICTIISSLLLLVFFRRNWRSSPEIFCLLPVAPIGAGLRRICKQGRGQQVSASRGLREEMKISVLKRNEVRLKLVFAFKWILSDCHIKCAAASSQQLIWHCIITNACKSFSSALHTTSHAPPSSRDGANTNIMWRLSKTNI